MAQNKKAQIVTTGRCGPLRMVLGCLLLALGFGWLLALPSASASSYNTLMLLRDLTHGLGGVMCVGFPVLALWSGVLLCVSSTHKVSVRVYWIVLMMYWVLMGILTLAGSAGGSPLMEYIINGNKMWLNEWNNATYSACLKGAYFLRDFNSGKLAGGGLLGMVLAWPLYMTTFGREGGIFLLAALELVLLLWLVRFNLLDAIGSFFTHRAQYRQEQKAAAEQEEEAQQPFERAPEQKRTIDMRPLIPTQQVTYSTGTSVQSDPEESYLVQDKPYTADPYEDTYTAPAQMGGFYPEDTLYPDVQDVPVGDDYTPEQTIEQPAWNPPAETKEPVQKKESRNKKSESKTTAEPYASVEPASYTGQTKEPLPWYEDDEVPLPIEEPFYEEKVEQQEIKAPPVKLSALEDKKPREKKEKKTLPPEPKAAAVRVDKHVVDEVKQVYTDPAFDLGGQRVSIMPQAPGKPADDPFAVKHTREALRPATASYQPPVLTLLRDPVRTVEDTSAEDAARAAELERTLASFHIDAKVDHVVHGPTITRFALQLADGVNVKRVHSVSDNLALTMKTVGLRIEVPIPGTSLVGIEVPNNKVRLVTLKEVLESSEMRNNPSPTVVALGLDIMGRPIICDLADMPHLLIAGATGSGKSACINAIVLSLLYRATPRQVRMIMIDPKVVELQPYNGIPHLLTEVVTEPKKAIAALDWVVQEMEERYQRLQQMDVRKIENYNEKMKNEADKMPEIVVIIDEFSDLMSQCRKQVEESIKRIAAKARAAGIYMIIATQRPSVDVITGVIKANIPSRIAFAVSTDTDSRTILGTNGAEKLLGKGDMLYAPRNAFKPTRAQGCFVSDGEVNKITDQIKQTNECGYDSRIDEHMERMLQEEDARGGSGGGSSSGGEMEPEYQPDTQNEMLQKAIDMALINGQMSISQLRRSFDIGHSKAGKLLDTMVKMGIISAEVGPKPRRTLITREQYAKMQGEIMDE